MWGSIPPEIEREAFEQFWDEYQWPDVRPLFAPVVRRHPPTYQEWLDSLPWVRLPPLIPRDDSPDKGRSRLRFRGYSDSVTMNHGHPLRLRYPEFELRPKRSSFAPSVLRRTDPW